MIRISYLFLIIPVFIFTQSVNAQFHQIVGNGCQWDEEASACTNGTDPPCYIDGYAFYTIGDTFTNNLKYYKLYTKPTYEIVDFQNGQYIASNDTTSIKKLIGGLREDSSGKVYFIAFDTSSFSRVLCAPLQNDTFYKHEFLLYDFNIHVGDSIYTNPCGIVYEVDIVDSFPMMDGTYRKSFGLNSNRGSIDIIEGVGSTIGLFGLYENPPFEGGTDLICYHDTASFLYSRSSLSGADTIECYKTLLGIKEINAIANHIHLSPNPATNEIRIINDADPKSEVLIYNSIGQIEGKFSLYKRSETLNIRDLPQGIYFLKIQTESGNVTFSLLKL